MKGKKIFHAILMISCLKLFWSCQEPETYDLAIADINIFDSETKKIIKNKTILINSDTIASIVDNAEIINAETIIEGNNRLACPGFIDTHIHLSDIFGGYDNAPEYLNEDSLSTYQRMLANEYLDYGVTTIRDAGHTEKWLNVTLLLQREHLAISPNIYLSGAALISDDEREPYPGHVEIKDSIDARRKVFEYYNKDIRQIKIYWRLREPELRSTIVVADSLGLNIYGHFDNNIVTIPRALSYNVKHFEHVLTIFKSVFDYKEYWNDFQLVYKRNFKELSFGSLTLEILHYVDSVPELNQELNELIRKMAAKQASLSTSIHIFGSFVNKAKFKTQMQVDMEKGQNYKDMSHLQRERLKEDFSILMDYCLIAHNEGVRLCIGTDCPNGGKALLSELLLLYEAGFTMEDILQIATLNGADAIDHGNKYGSIKVGKIADIVLFEKNPFEDYTNLLSSKKIIKGGKIYN